MGDKNHIVFVVSYIPQELKATSKIDHRRPRGMKWVLANKQICQEAIGHFHREATWAVLDTAFRGPFGMTSHWSQPYNLRHTSFQRRLFVPMSARHIVVYDSIAVIPRPEGECDGKPNWHIQTDWHFLDRLVLGLHNTNNLQSLTLTLHTEIYATQEEALEQAPDDISIWTSMGRLHAFNAPNLRKAEFKIKCSAEFEARRDFVLAFEEYLNEVVMCLIGGKGVMTSRDVRTLPREAVYTYTRTREGE